MAKQPRAIGGRVVAITGAARGIGKATAATLAREGASVAIGDVDLGLAQATAEELGPRVRAYPVDVTSRSSFAEFLDSVERDLGPLDVLVNNAGIMPIGPLIEEDEATAQRLVDINVHGVIHGVKEALPRMLAHGGGHVVNLASLAGKGGFPHLATYCATKHAVVGLSEAMRAELRGKGIEVTCVMPSLVNTELTSGLKAGPGVEKVEPEDVAAAILGALRQPRFEVYVPRSIGPMTHFIGMLPRRAAEALGRVLGADKVMVQADMATRAAYERRIAEESEQQQQQQQLETSEV
jgi:NADP-dependent 3-hydroxy acid dehydrogenase YdfG